MKEATSTLNPYAASYIPLSRRGTFRGTEDFSKNDIYNTSPANNLQNVESAKLKVHPVHGYYGSSSHHAYELAESKTADDEFDMEMAYLQMTFPGISNQSLSDVYSANRGDLEATVDMLNQLEHHSDSSKKLPDTLDIGDVSEPSLATEFSSPKLKKVTNELGTPSSSGS